MCFNIFADLGQVCRHDLAAGRQLVESGEGRGECRFMAGCPGNGVAEFCRMGRCQADDRQPFQFAGQRRVERFGDANIESAAVFTALGSDGRFR